MQSKPISRRGFLRGAFGETVSNSPNAILPFYDIQGFTPNTHFYRQQLRHIPQITPVYWMLRLHGQVENSLFISLHELMAMPSVEGAYTLACIGSTSRSPMIGNARWRGVSVSDLMSQINVAEGANYAQLYAADGYTTYLETSVLKSAMLAYEMNGESLPAEHGYPVRLIVPGRYGYKMPKWIQRVEFTDQPAPGFWEARGWSPTAQAQTISTIFSPRHLENVSSVVRLAGAAYAGENTIEGIEISINDADWMPVPIAPGTAYQWTPWQMEWTPPAPGDYRIKVRATDSMGFIQADDSRVSAFPNGPTALHTIVVRVVE
jgi:hypothetical protein